MRYYSAPYEKPGIGKQPTQGEADAEDEKQLRQVNSLLHLP